ncbi:hypothetical protein DVH05_015791 [Phytophthora capsici]|nr:hypothetical protein DVH05_015791 [Phytophthora capsici]
MEVVWNGIREKDKLVKEGLRGCLENWHQASASKTALVINPIESVETPQQPDFASCGVMVVSQVFSYLTNNHHWHLSNVSKDSIKVMRLRMLWVILCYSKQRRIPRSTPDKVRLIHQQLVEQLK